MVNSQNLLKSQSQSGLLKDLIGSDNRILLSFILPVEHRPLR
jgi:hypothetical protein